MMLIVRVDLASWTVQRVLPIVRVSLASQTVKHMMPFARSNLASRTVQCMVLMVRLSLASETVWCTMQIIRDNLATDGFMPQAQKTAMNSAKQWLAQQWPHYFKLRPLNRLNFLAPQQGLSGADNNTSNPVHRRERHGE